MGTLLSTSACRSWRKYLKSYQKADLLCSFIGKRSMKHLHKCMLTIHHCRNTPFIQANNLPVICFDFSHFVIELLLNVLAAWSIYWHILGFIAGDNILGAYPLKLNIAFKLTLEFHTQQFTKAVQLTQSPYTSKCCFSGTYGSTIQRAMTIILFIALKMALPSAPWFTRKAEFNRWTVVWSADLAC